MDYNLKQIEKLKEELFNETNIRKKQEYKEQIDKLIAEVTDNNKAFDFEIYFSEVFEDKEEKNRGFDIVIANPPYIGERGHKEIFREIRKSALVSFYLRKMDIFYFFFHLALNLGKYKSNIAFITTNYYITAMGAKKLRQDFKERSIIRHLINFNELKLFKSAQGQHNMITILSKSKNDPQKDSINSYNSITKRSGFAKPNILHQILSWQDQETEYYIVPQKDLYDGPEAYMRLSGKYSNSSNVANGILEKMEGKYSLEDVCFVNMGVQSGADIVGRKLLDRALSLGYINKEYLEENNIDFGTPIYVVDQTFVNTLLPEERSIIKPFIKNSDLDKYYVPSEYQHYYIYADSQTNIKNMPSILNHLMKFRPILKAREQVNDKNNSWFWIRGSKRQFLVGTGEHIICPYRARENIFALTNGNILGAGDVYFITRKDNSILLRYVLALLNSKLYYLWLYHKGKRKGEILELYQKPLSEIPITKISEGEQEPFIELVNKILAITSSSDYLSNTEKQARVKDYQKQIDQLVYKLYGLTPEEIAIVEGQK
ncbi:MAG: Eco57I restriction-modification methylase domain-containing protein [Candidatus Levybacteria bacterium]|nr:Eco57I restriction-modification methylase domain-containing protein [Candidatus Levybacteria bacterium]